MKQNIKLELLTSIGKVYDQSKGCKLDSTFFDRIDDELQQLSAYFSVSHNQSFIIAMVFALNYKGDTVDLNDLIEYFECNPMKLLEFSDDFETLLTKGILKKIKSRHRVKLAFTNNQFMVNEKISEAILKNNLMPVIEIETYKDAFDILKKLFSLSEQRDNEEIFTEDLFEQANDLICKHLHFPLIKKIDDLGFGIQESYLFLYMIWRTISGKDYSEIGQTAELIYDNPTERVQFVQKIVTQEHVLIKENYIELVEAQFFNDSDMKLSESSVKMLKQFGLKIYSKQNKRDNIIIPSTIQTKALFFNEPESKQLNVLKAVLQDMHFKETQARLEIKGLSKGITALLYGLPGTGKTETVYQLAKDTEREIIKVDISQSKSMWFGESEKIIKRIFTDYKAYAEDCERTPILLFNEADAIISKRMENTSSNVRQTENTIQNILLEELEMFEGIFLATTNLAKNLDSAFERRFLFKIEFHKPDIPVKAKIWNSKLPILSESECEILARNFDFSGGQIDNIVRKNEIHEILHGISIDFNNIVEFCKTECLNKNSGVTIGFTKI